MKFYILFCVAVTATLADNIFHDYHERIGIPLAARIKEAETAALQSGSRIIGGQPAPLGAHPYLVGLLLHFSDGRVSVCGASMLSHTRSVTAAHCWRPLFDWIDSLTLVFGSEYIFYGGVRVDSNDVVVHPEWQGFSNTMGFDIAMIRHAHVAYNNIIQAIALPSGALESETFTGVYAQASGYGLIADGFGLQPNQVQSTVTLQVISNDVCRLQFPTVINDYLICTSGAGPAGICSSDSGGPLSIINNSQRVLIGVVSFGSGICEGGNPDGYVRVTAHLPWIRSLL